MDAISHTIFWSLFGLDNGLVPSKWQAIIWTSGGQFTEAYTVKPLI